MEKNINIAEILKNVPIGTKLYSPLFGDVFLKYIEEIFITVRHHGTIASFYHNGRLYDYEGTEQMLYPSRQMRDWSKIVWKKGDVLVHKDGDVHIIFERFVDDTYCSFVGKYYLWKENNDAEHFYKNEQLLTSDFQKAGKDAQTYISTIEERLGGKLNRETLEIEKTQPEFKDGDVAAVDEIPFDLYSKCIFILKENLNTGENKARAYVLYNINKDSIFFDTPVMKVIERNIHLATEEEKQQLFDALAKEGKAWDAEKKQIVDLKPKVEFKSFDKVLCRNSKDDTWEADFFARLTRKEIDYTQSGKYLCVGDLWMYCIPYNEETAHLLGTTDDWERGGGEKMVTESD